MDKFSVDKEILKDMLSEAFDSGWYGIKELKDLVIEDLIAKFESRLAKINEPKSLNFDYVSFATPQSRVTIDSVGSSFVVNTSEQSQWSSITSI